MTKDEANNIKLQVTQILHNPPNNPAEEIAVTEKLIGFGVDVLLDIAVSLGTIAFVLFEQEERTRP